jgi:predicted alpha/beta hydrolase family esterase
MNATLLIIHGAGNRSFKQMSERWVPFVQKALGPDVQIICPSMPNPQFPQYSLWRETIRENLNKIRGPLILIGHSLGGTLLLKYLTEEKVQNTIHGIFIIASPYFSEKAGWNYQDFFIEKDPDQVLRSTPLFSYHSTDDQVVPVGHQAFLMNHFPHAEVKTLSGHGHEFNRKEFKEIIEDIKRIRASLGRPAQKEI